MINESRLAETEEASALYTGLRRSYFFMTVGLLYFGGGNTSRDDLCLVMKIC